MASKVDQSVVKRTIDTLGKVIKAPALTEKLLSRPPFRYLHDIITQVNKASGFFSGLYTSQEKDPKSSSMQEKEAKILFLQKAISTLSFTVGEVVGVRPSKIVAGQEVEKTNEFLQILANAVLKKMDSADAVKRALKGEVPGASEKSGKKEEKEKKPRVEKVKAESTSKRSRSKERPHEPAGKRSGSDATKSKDSVTKEERKASSSTLQSRSQQQLSGGSESSSRPVHRPSRKRSSVVNSIADREEPPPQPPTGGGSGSDGVEDEGLGSETKVDRPSSARGSRKLSSHPSVADHIPETLPPSGPPTNGPPTNGRKGEDVANRSPSPPAQPPQGAPPIRRPSSARPAPPRVANQKEDATGVIASSHMADLPPTVIMDTPGGGGGDNEMDEDDDQFMVVDSTPLAPPPEEAFAKVSEGIDDKPEGALTKKLVAMKEHLEGNLEKEGDGAKSSALPAISEAQRRKEREIVSKEIEKLQSSIQTLCKSANPLGKIMDYVQEDIDSMQKELEMWQAENRKHTEALHREQSITELELQPLRAQLEELEAKIVEQVEMISGTKAGILKNDVKTQQMLNSMAFASS